MPLEMIGCGDCSRLFGPRPSASRISTGEATPKTLRGARRGRYTDSMDERALAQLCVIRLLVNALRAADISAWLFGGWGLDARIGRITRDHGDIEFWVARADSERSRSILVAAGATALTTQPPEEACEFTWDGIEFSTAYFDRQPDGTCTTMGRQSDWVFPAGSFSNEPGVLDGIAVPAMSVAGMLAMKEQFPTLRHGKPWRAKDQTDVEVLRVLAADSDAKE